MEHDLFKVGMSSRTRDGDLSDLGKELDQLQALGVDFVELSAFDFDLIAGGRIRTSQMATLLDTCRGRDLSYSVHGPLALNFMDTPERLPLHFNLLEASLDIAAELGAKHYVLHAGMTMETDPALRRDAYHRQREWLTRAGNLAQARDLHVCVETLFEHDDWKHTPCPGRLAAELEAIAHPNIGATLDFGHSYLKMDAEGRRSDLVSECAALAPHARHLHLHDCFGRQEGMWTYTFSEQLALGLGDLHLPIGWGDIPWQELMSQCVLPKDTLFVIELNPRFLHAAGDCLAQTRALAALARSGTQTPAEIRMPVT
ncbi:sugar phosphate isomerase/epimerase [Stappia stellulata]|uniref:sugar phosphate isomerase/epimerase family protein n=1 Tax=Stappia stellulata TaxID=71235 RepID=UPI001CD7F4C5|nr:sugar phosphate isomerase/epimerase [Stappia stellulata]MCA1242102.1 sugar phosphate isomerase/epimerase [Stappia stellulata]